MHLRIAHDSAFAHLALRGLKLRLHQNDHSARRREQRRDRRNKHGGGDETGVADGQIERLGTVSRLKVPRVDAFADGDARVVPDLPIELAMADVKSPDVGRAALKQAVGEASRGSADVEARPARGMNLKVIESGRQLEAAAADVRHPLADFDAR